MLAAAFLLSPAASAEAAKRFKGPVEATVIEIIDGDTFLAEAHVWPGTRCA
jgi:endonuclease YncB( thermonuclease family)